MMLSEWADILPGKRFYAPFAAKKRAQPRIAPSPSVLHVEVPYQQWSGAIGPWAEHFGKGMQQVHSLDNSEPTRSCNEVEIAKLFRRAGWSAYWVSCYSASKLPPIWQPFAIAPSAMPSWLVSIDLAIRNLIRHRSGGIPDVAAWMPADPSGTVVFVECKGPKENIKENQEDWVSAAIEGGLSRERFGVAIRMFV